MHVELIVARLNIYNFGKIMVFLFYERRFRFTFFDGWIKFGRFEN